MKHLQKIFSSQGLRRKFLYICQAFYAIKLEGKRKNQNKKRAQNGEVKTFLDITYGYQERHIKNNN